MTELEYPEIHILIVIGWILIRYEYFTKFIKACLEMGCGNIRAHGIKLNKALAQHGHHREAFIITRRRRPLRLRFNEPIHIKSTRSRIRFHSKVDPIPC